TPLEVRKKKGDFRRAMRGYDPELVDDFLDLVADRLEQLVRENMALQERIAQQNSQVADYRERERALTEALVSAQEMREEVRRQAAREAELAKKAAEQYAEQLRTKAEAESSRVLASIREERLREEEALRRARARQQEFLASYRAFLEEELAELAVIARAAGSPVRSAKPQPPAVPVPEPVDEPFEPEAFVEEEAEVVAEALEVEAAELANGETDDAEVSGEGAELKLYDSIASAEVSDGVPGPIGLGPEYEQQEEEWSGAPDWSIDDLKLVDADTGGEDIELLDEEEDDPETLALLRNAAAAGYRLTPDEQVDELLLDEAITEEPSGDEPDDDGWLPTLLDDDK